MEWCANHIVWWSTCSVKAPVRWRWFLSMLMLALPFALFIFPYFSTFSLYNLCLWLLILQIHWCSSNTNKSSANAYQKQHFSRLRHQHCFCYFAVFPFFTDANAEKRVGFCSCQDGATGGGEISGPCHPQITACVPQARIVPPKRELCPERR